MYPLFHVFHKNLHLLNTHYVCARTLLTLKQQQKSGDLIKVQLAAHPQSEHKIL